MNASVDYQNDLVEEQEFRLSDYIQIVKRRRKPFWLTLGLILALTLGAIAVLPPVYRSSALVMVQQQELTTGLLGSALQEQADQSIEYLARSIMRDETLLGLIEKFELFPDFRDQVSNQEMISRLEESIHIKIVNPEVIGAQSRRPGQNAQVAFEISFDYHRDPEVAQSVTAELVRLFMSENLQKRLQITEETTAFLASEASKIEVKINSVEERLASFKEQNTGLLPSQIEVAVNERDRTERELIAVEQQISSAKSSSVQLQGQMAGTEAYIYEDRTLIRNDEGERVLSATGRLQTLQQQYYSLISKYSDSHPRVVKVRREIESLGGAVGGSANPLTNDELEIAESNLAEARQKYSGSHPTVRRLETKVQSLRAQVRPSAPVAQSKEFNTLKRVNPAFSALKAGISQSQAELQSLLTRKTTLQAKLDDYSSRMEDAPQVEKAYGRLERDHEDLLREYRDLKEKLATAERAEALEVQQKGDRFSLLEEPNLPRGPVSPNRPAIVLLGGMLAVGLAITLVMLLEALDDSVTSRRALVAITGAQPLGSIPLILETSDAESMQRRSLMKGLTWLLVIAGAVGAIVWVHTSVMPLTEIINQVARKVQLLAF